MHTWQIITGEYPGGGVGDYTRRVAAALARTGDEVHVWTPRSVAGVPNDAGVLVHGLPGHFGPRALAVLDRAIGAVSESMILVQYVPHAFGFKAMNLPFCCWLLARRRHKIFLMFHEVAFAAASPRFRDKVLEVVTKLMAVLATRAASRIFVSTVSWERVFEQIGIRGLRIETVPVPSNVDVINDPPAIQGIRARYGASKTLLVGHFSAFPQNVQPYLAASIPALLADERVRVMLIGKGSGDFRQKLALQCDGMMSRLHATGDLGAHDLSVHLSACDLMIQPYPDGITTRRGSAMAAIAHGRPVVTTKGWLTEPIWSDNAAVLLAPVNNTDNFVSTTCGLLDDPGERERLSLAAAKLYHDSFDLRHTIDILRS
jgi:glycosyltransferase involved in cell wall biosynthesis